MELIIGGAYQGKLTHAISQHSLERDEMLDLAEITEQADFSINLSRIRCVYHLESLTYHAVKSGSCPAAFDFIDNLIKSSPKVIIISREVGSGIVPMDKDERLFREFHGEILSKIAARADRVMRVFCGICTRIKG